MVDNGRNDCVDSMVNDVEIFFFCSTTKTQHNKISDAPLFRAGEDVVIDMCDGILMKLTMIVT